MAIEFLCPHCKHLYRLKDELAGKTATCKTCRAKITIPEPVTVPPGGRLSAEELAAREAAALAALADEKAPEKDPAADGIAVECQFCAHKWTEPLTRAGKNTLCPNPECRQRVKIPEPKPTEARGNWREPQTKLPSLAKQHAEKLEGVVDAAADAQMVSGKALKDAGAIDEELEPRSLKRMAMFGFVILALAGGLIYGVASLFTSRTAGKEDRLMRESIEEFAKTTGALPAGEAPAEALLCQALLEIAGGEHAVRHNTPEKLKEGMEHFAKARDALRKAPPGPVRNAVAGELAAALLALGGTDEEVRGQVRIRWTPEFTVRPRLNERVYTVHEELRQTLALVQGAPTGPGADLFDFKNHLARRLTRTLAKAGQGALALDLLPLALFAAPEQDEGRALIALEIYRHDKNSPLPRKASDDLKARGPELLKGNPTPASAQTLALVVEPEKPRQFISPPATDPVSEPSRLAYAGKLLLDGEVDEALKLARRRGSVEGQLRALVLCADWAADPTQSLDEALGFATANKGSKQVSPYLLVRLAQLAAEKGKHEQAKEFARLIADDGVQAWARGAATHARVAAGSKEKADETWAEVPPGEKLPKELRAGHAWGRLWAARQNTRLSGNRSGEVKAVGAWPTAVAPFGRAGVALGLQDQ